MSYRYYNPNPKNRSANDCVIRAFSKIYNISWDDAYDLLWEIGKIEKEIPTTNYVWEKYLLSNGFRKHSLPLCPNCIDVNQFSKYYNNNDVYLVCTGSHVVAVVDGDYYDAWDSGSEPAMYYFSKL